MIGENLNQNAGHDDPDESNVEGPFSSFETEEFKIPEGKLKEIGETALGDIKNHSNEKDYIDGTKSEGEKQSIDEKIDLNSRFEVDPKEYPIFASQAGVRENRITHKMESRTLNINETLGKMVGKTADLVATLKGEKTDVPKIDHVIYLDKSARPVSWLVDEFWDDFADEEPPEKSYLAIDRRPWFDRVDVRLIGHEEIEEPDGTLRPAVGSDFWKAFSHVPKEKQKDWLARIRALYIEGGITSEDPDEIMATPTVLDGKNLLVVDEVSRTGSTLSIAEGLLKLAIPELASVNGHVFWSDAVRFNESGNMQMGNTPAWYPQDSADWRGRGVKDIDPDYYLEQYMESPSPKTMAENYGSFVLGVPLENWDDEPGKPSKELWDEIKKMRQDYDAGHILPNVPIETMGDVAFRVMDKMSELGVEFSPNEGTVKKPNSYATLIEERDKKSPV